MIVYPAIDIRQGQVVRLLHGDPTQQTIHAADPVAVAQRWQAAGASWLHVVNLDGALGEAVLALDTLRLLAKVGLPIQFGGGMRTLDDVGAALDAGASRVILGTMAVQNPAVAAEAVRRFGPQSITVALDAKGDQVATHGWQQVSAWTPAALGKRFKADGVIHALYTDIGRDGDLSGVNIEATARLAQDTGLEVIASGGVASLNDLIGLRQTGQIAGVIIGKALYTNAFTLQDALRISQQDE